MKDRPFNFCMGDLLDYLEFKEENSLLNAYKYQRMTLYRRARGTLLRELIKILIRESLLTKMFNAKKYMCMFALLSLEIIEEISRSI
jgi:hypothetical protein